MKKTALVFLLVALSLVMAAPAAAAPPAGVPAGGKPASTGVIYVTGQGLYYDVITPVSGDKGLPMQGPFQQLDPTTNPPSTEFGPGDAGYLGGRWWVDANGNGEMDESDVYFLCPLLGPGRDTP